MPLVLVLILLAPTEPLAVHTALPPATQLLSEICQLDTGGIHQDRYLGGDPAERLTDLLAARGSAHEISCAGDHLCELSATVRLGSASLSIEAGVFRRGPDRPFQLHTVRMRGPLAVLEKARTHAGCP